VFFTTCAVNSPIGIWGSKSNFVHFSNNIFDFSENQLTKFLVFSPLSHTGMIFLWKEVTVWFLLVQRSAGMAYRLILSHFEPWLEATNINGMLIVVKVLENFFSQSLLLARGTVCLWVMILRVYTELSIVARTEIRLQKISDYKCWWLNLCCLVYRFVLTLIYILFRAEVRTLPCLSVLFNIFDHVILCCIGTGIGQTYLTFELIATWAYLDHTRNCDVRIRDESLSLLIGLSSASLPLQL